MEIVQGKRMIRPGLLFQGPDQPKLFKSAKKESDVIFDYHLITNYKAMWACRRALSELQFPIAPLSSSGSLSVLDTWEERWPKVKVSIFTIKHVQKYSQMVTDSNRIMILSTRTTIQGNS